MSNEELIITHVNPEQYDFYKKSIGRVEKNMIIRENPFIPINVMCYEYADELVFIGEDYYLPIKKIEGISTADLIKAFSETE